MHAADWDGCLSAWRECNQGCCRGAFAYAGAAIVEMFINNGMVKRLIQVEVGHVLDDVVGRRPIYPCRPSCTAMVERAHMRTRDGEPSKPSKEPIGYAPRRVSSVVAVKADLAEEWFEWVGDDADDG